MRALTLAKSLQKTSPPPRPGHVRRQFIAVTTAPATLDFPKPGGVEGGEASAETIIFDGAGQGVRGAPQQGERAGGDTGGEAGMEMPGGGGGGGGGGEGSGSSGSNGAPKAGAGDLPAGWTAHKDPDTNFTYYCHEATGVSRWELQKELAKAMPKAAAAHKLAGGAGLHVAPPRGSVAGEGGERMDAEVAYFF
jgi:hypothetical protein